MSWYTIVSGIIALFATIGHFTIGSSQFLRPMLEASFDTIARKVMHCVFHYISVFFILSTVALLAVGLGALTGEGTTLLIRFISINFAAFALWQIILAIASGIPNGIFKMFQWVFFVLIAIFGWLGA